VGDPIAYFEVGSADFQTLVSYYRELFGWVVTEAGDGYMLIDTRAGTGINGGIGRSRDGNPWVSFYVAVDDPQAALDRAAALGGSAVVPVTAIPGLMTWAMFTDPDGNLVGLVRFAGGPVTGRPGAGDGVAVDWFEVLGADVERTQRFYCDLFGWAPTRSGVAAFRPVDTQSGEDAIGGGLGGVGDAPTWATVYARVPELAAVLANAEQLGGHRVYGPNQVDDHTQTAAFRDPAGNVFGVYQRQPP
jgi:predicted enzyme related to lactoylglutathione lyase